MGDEQAVLIMDNAPVHMNMQRNFPNLEIKYLPAYSPFLNPIENCFSVFKTYLKHFLHATVGQCTPVRAAREGTTLQALRERLLLRGVETALPHVTQDIVCRNYNHANTYLAKCIQEDDLY